ncbi:MAG: response regulator [Spirochaetales bacterium]|nr:response regulator [Leptospiraceae bacterium]MCP5479967.1 response regulator [Spirochaetales bacterium]MCP5486597.1 response regulator [Spirochaetales bacterium]
MQNETTKILIADDQASVRNMLSDLVSHAGFTALMAENGEEAVTMATTHRPGVIILDLMMPVKNGLQAAQEIRAVPELAETPILFLTARGQPQDEARTKEAGGSAFISKPFSPRQVLATIQQLLNP